MGKEPEGSTANLPPMEDIVAAEESRAEDIDALYGITDDGTQGEGGDPLTSPASGAGGDEGSSPAPVNSQAGPEPAASPGEGAAPAQTATEGKGTSSAPQAQPSQPDPAAQQPTAAPSEEALRLASLEASNQALIAEIARLRANPPQPAPAPQQQGQPQGGSSAEQIDLPKYALQLPQPVAEAIFGEETTPERQMAGITHMMNSLATIVHARMRQEVKESFAALLGTARHVEQEGRMVSTMESMRQDYFANFPTHRDPLVLPLVQAEAAAMTTAFPGVSWNEQMRNALGQRVEARLAALRGGGGQQPPAQPATMIPNGPREGVAPGTELAGGELIMDTFS